MFCGSSPRCQDGFTFEFLCATAADAHNMVVLTVIFNGELEAPAPLTELKFLQKSHVGQEAQRAIHRRQRHLHVELHQLLVHVFRTEVIAGSQPFKQFQNTLALWS